ncbi:serine hydrolase domain-containing protein [Hymenobacter oligotrophus]|uniref:serine hydrolase domain-containing protein n=1 Tax=Hymenobacter oligotrophus TaxID=2319843 RepID=UPI0013C369F7|nr:serine hydrolase domain-containing protein [Hymenobacter oligotrophus]
MKKWLTVLLGLWSLAAVAQTGVSEPELAQCDAAVQRFLQRWKIPGATVAISRQGKLVYSRGFGHANLERTELMQPSHLLRVASVSKPVTAVAIMKLVEDGQVQLTRKAFGPEGYLNMPYYTGVIEDKRIYDITVQQLLEHTAGWNRNAGVDGFSSSDPIDFPLHVAAAMQVPNPVPDSTLVRYLLSKGLNFTPGSRFAYSNIGYIVLGKIIERVTGQPYEAWVRRHVLEPTGVSEAHLGHNLLADKLEREAEYFSKDLKESCYGTGKRVPYPYGGWNLEAMNAHGGWLFSARDLVRLVLAIDGLPTRPDLLLPATLDTMTTSHEPNRRYAKGWLVNKDRTTWWHTGSLDGTASCVVRTASGYTWAILLNGRSTTNRFWNDLEELGWECINGTATWPIHDLFPPERNARNLRVASLCVGTARLAWHNGNGSARLLVLQEKSPVRDLPQDGTNYVADASFGRGAILGHGSVVAAGPDSTVTVRALQPGKTYYARLVEYHQTAATGQHPVYALEGNPVLEFTMPAAPVVAKSSKAGKAALARAGKARAKRAPQAVRLAAPNFLPTADAESAQPGQPMPVSPATEPQSASYWIRLREMSRGLLKWLGTSS